MITIIIPCLNERKNINLIYNNLKLFSNVRHIIVDANSKDNSRVLFKKKRLNFIITSPSRGIQLKKGAEASNTRWLLFLHADTILNKKNISDIYSFMIAENIYKAGFFKLKYKNKKFLAKIISNWANFRSRIFKLPFGDQGLLISRYYYFKLGAHPETPIMEDLEFILKVPKNKRLLLKSEVSTSFRRFEKNGILLQGLTNILCQIMFMLNIKKNTINKIYNFYGK